MILTEASFAHLRKNFGTLSAAQVRGMNFLVLKMTEAGFTYPEAAYGLATIWHETDRTMMPVVERGSDAYLSKYDTGKLAANLGNTPTKDGDGQLFKGRGYTQITGTDNYRKFSAIVGVDLIKNPDFALQPDIAAKIMTHGMLYGLFTGVGFRNKRPVDKYDLNKYVAARAIINGSDKALTIANYAILFEQALRR